MLIVDSQCLRCLGELHCSLQNRYSLVLSITQFDLKLFIVRIVPIPAQLCKFEQKTPLSNVQNFDPLQAIVRNNVHFGAICDFNWTVVKSLVEGDNVAALFCSGPQSFVEGDIIAAYSMTREPLEGKPGLHAALQSQLAIKLRLFLINHLPCGSSSRKPFCASTCSVFSSCFNGPIKVFSTPSTEYLSCFPSPRWSAYS